MDEKVVVFNINPVHKGDILASCSVHIKPWHLKINEVLVFEKGANRWVSLPSRKYLANDNTEKYAPLLEFDEPGMLKKFRDHIMDAVDRYIAANGSLEPVDPLKDIDECPF